MTDDVWESFATASWHDLAVNLPGDVVRRRADELAAQWQSRGKLSRLLMPRIAERRWRRGAEGAGDRRQRLSTLDVGWYLLNDVPLPDLGARDRPPADRPRWGLRRHSRRSHPGKKVYVSGETTLVNGFRHYHDADQQVAGRTRVAQQLTRSVGFDVEVTAIVAVVSAKELLVREQPRDGRVHVTSARGARTLDTPAARANWVRPTRSSASSRWRGDPRPGRTSDAWLVDSLLGYWE